MITPSSLNSYDDGPFPFTFFAVILVYVAAYDVFTYFKLFRLQKHDKEKSIIWRIFLLIILVGALPWAVWTTIIGFYDTLLSVYASFVKTAFNSWSNSLTSIFLGFGLLLVFTTILNELLIKPLLRYLDRRLPEKKPDHKNDE
jgi:uncharacterized membrane protein YfcA